MKISLQASHRLTAFRRQAAFTMAEIMTVSAIFLVLMVGVIYGYLFGLNLFQITKIKLGASDDARKAVIAVTDQIRNATSIQIGNGYLGAFTQVGSNSVQVGNACQIYSDSTGTNWYRYFYDTNTTKLEVTQDGINYSLVIAHSITNLVPVFSSEDSYGNPLTNNLNNRVIGMTLQFYQIEYPIVYIGPGYYYDFYQLRTKVTRRDLY